MSKLPRFFAIYIPCDSPIPLRFKFSIMCHFNLRAQRCLIILTPLGIFFGGGITSSLNNCFIVSCESLLVVSCLRFIDANCSHVTLLHLYIGDYIGGGRYRRAPKENLINLSYKVRHLKENIKTLVFFLLKTRIVICKSLLFHRSYEFIVCHTTM
ncbi:hypothetical protein M758_4G171100 [Ceratodon purpureus]|nr:hypothetical protein M758_4G171100 [Ceratodon purpureus]